MSAKAYLARRNGDFLNLHELILGVCRADGCSYSEAARALLQLFNDIKQPIYPWEFDQGDAKTIGVEILGIDYERGVHEAAGALPYLMELLSYASFDGEPIPF